LMQSWADSACPLAQPVMPFVRLGLGTIGQKVPDAASKRAALSLRNDQIAKVRDRQPRPRRMNHAVTVRANQGQVLDICLAAVS
jgi:hypothetical protein